MTERINSIFLFCLVPKGEDSRMNLKKSASSKYNTKKGSFHKRVPSSHRVTKKPSGYSKNPRDNFKKSNRAKGVTSSASRSKVYEHEKTDCCPCFGTKGGRENRAVKNPKIHQSPVTKRQRQSLKYNDPFLNPHAELKKPAIRKISSKKFQKPVLPPTEQIINVPKTIQPSMKQENVVSRKEEKSSFTPPELPTDDIKPKNIQIPEKKISMKIENNDLIQEESKLGQTLSRLQPSKEDLAVTPEGFTSEEKNFENMKEENEIDSIPADEIKTDEPSHSPVKKTFLDGKEFIEQTKEIKVNKIILNGNKEDVTTNKRIRYKSDLVPFYMKINYNTIKPLIELNDLWFKSIDNYDEYTNISKVTLEQAEKCIYQNLNENDELANLFIERIELSKKLSEKELKLNVELQNKRDIRYQLTHYNSLTYGSNIKEQFSTVFDNLLKRPKSLSKISQFSYKYTKENAIKSASAVFHKISRKIEEKDAVQQEQEKDGEQLKIKTHTSISSNNEETKASAWQLAKRFDFFSDPEFEERKARNREKFLSVLEQHVCYKGPTRGPFQMPTIDFPLSLPNFNANALGDNQLKDLYISHWKKLVPNGDKNCLAFPKLKFINPTHLTFVKSKQTENAMLLGVGKKSIVVAGYMQDTGNSTSEILMESSWSLQVEGHINNYSGRPTAINNHNANGQLAVAIKMYKTSSISATAINLVREAVMMNYVNTHVKFGGPQFLGLVNLSSNRDFLPIGIVSVLNGDPETFEVVTLDRLLWQEVRSRGEDPPKQILQNIRWVKLLLNLSKLLHKYHRHLIVLNKLRMNSIVLRHIKQKGWTCPRPINLSEATIMSHLSKCRTNDDLNVSRGKANNAGDNLTLENRSFAADITALGSIIRDINLALNLGLEGIVEYIQPTTPANDYWSTCNVIEALDGALTELKNAAKKKILESQVVSPTGKEKLKSIIRTSLHLPSEEKKNLLLEDKMRNRNSTTNVDSCFKCCRR